jgi:alcohol dehydrogenase (NADP+)
MVDTKFQGWLGKDEKSVEGNMVWGEFEPKKWTEDDVDIEIDCCGICGSDLHMLKSGWGPTPYPCVVGHEIIGKAVKVGKNVQHIKQGARVGVGAQARSCMQKDCPDCKNGLENHCHRETINTYGSVYPRDEGKSYGGYATHNRTNGHFVMSKSPSHTPTPATNIPQTSPKVSTPLTQHPCSAAASLSSLLSSKTDAAPAKPSASSASAA